jgi:Sir2- and TIR-associating SLOG family
LRRYGIMAVMLDSFAQYKETLRRLEKSYRTQQVFISGSASSYAPWSEDNAHKFLTLLGKHLAQRGMNVITGFGLGVGPHVINGVLDELEHEGTRTLSDRLTLRPFPYSIADPEKRQARWAGYRDEMISKAGVAIFVFGNKTDASGRLVPADGVLEEFKIAYNNGLLVVPVGSTGHVAQTIHAKVSADLDKYFPRVRGLKTALIALKRGGTPNQIVERVLKFIALVASEPVE